MYVIVVYLTIIGVLYLFFPGVAEKAFQVELSYRATAMLHGFDDLIMALLISTTVSNLQAYGKLVNIFQLFAVGETLIFTYQLISRMHSPFSRNNIIAVSDTQASKKCQNQ